MKLKIALLCFSLFTSCFSLSTFAQPDLLKLVDTSKDNTQTLSPTWKDTKLINVQTTKIVDPGVMEFAILHRFGNIGGASNGGFHTLYGFDVASDIEFAFQFGIIKNLMVGVSRSKQQELIDIDAKYKLLTQTPVGMPVSLAVYGDAGVTPELDATFYNGSDSTTSHQFIDRLSYFGEFMLDRRFGNLFSLELLAGIQHRNYALGVQNLNNGKTDQNNIPFIATGGRIMLTKHSSLVFDYYYIMSQYRMSNSANPFYNPISIGYEVETGGHVFEINYSNASFLDENNLIPYTRDTWTKGGFKLGFSISRVFNL